VKKRKYLQRVDGRWVLSDVPLGDWLESKLSAIGITKDRYTAFKQQFGMPPTCDCDKRREWLNQFGESFGAEASAALKKLFRRRQVAAEPSE
jgi:hypothetical protein